MRVAVSKAPMVIRSANPERAEVRATVFDGGKAEGVFEASVSKANTTTRPSSASKPITERHARIGNSSAAAAGSVACPPSARRAAGA